MKYYKISTFEYLCTLSREELYVLDHKYKEGNLDYIRKYAEDNNINHIHMYDFFNNKVNEILFFNKYIKEVESTHKDASFSERLKIVMDMV